MSYLQNFVVTGGGSVTDLKELQKSGVPTIADIPTGFAVVAKDTTQPAGFGNSVYANDNGTIVNITPKVFLNSNTTFYVSSGGSDFNNGLSAAHPWATLQHAVSTLATNVDANGFSITVMIADGTYAGFTMNGAPQGIGLYYQFLGNATTPANVIIQSASFSCIDIECFVPAQLQISALTLQPTGAGVRGITFDNDYVTINMAKVIFDGTLAACGDGVSLFNSFTELVLGWDQSGSVGGGARGCTWQGSWETMVGVWATAKATLTGVQTLTGTPSWTVAGIRAIAAGGVVQPGSSLSYTGSATGSRYLVTNGCTLIADGSFNLTFYPGSTAGTVTNGNYDGQFYDQSFPLPTYTTTLPASETASGRQFQFTFDVPGNLYMCYAANKWAKFTNVAPFTNVSGQQDAQPLGMP